MKNRNFSEIGNGGNARRLHFSPMVIELLKERPMTSQELFVNISTIRTIRYNEVLRVLHSMERDRQIYRCGSHYYIGDRQH